MKTKLPQGVQDYIGAECANKVWIEEKLAIVCSKYGYERIQTAAVEYMSAFLGTHGSLLPNRMFKITDRDGELLVVRPDATLQVSRIVADKFPDCDLKRFFYITDTFVADSKDYNRELAQVGVELTGSGDVGSDVEIVELAVKFCLEVGLKDFQIEIGNIDYFYGFIESLELDEEETEKLRNLINKKDLIGVSVLLRKKEIPSDSIEKINRLPFLFGGEDVLDEAEALAVTQTSRDAVTRLREVLSRLKEFGLDKYVSVDFGMVKTNNYYNGLVLRGISKSLGHSFIDGGRYDQLSHNHGIAKPAVGLSLWMKRLLMAIDCADGLKTEPIAELCVVCLDRNGEKTAYDYLLKKRGEGVKALRYFGNFEQAKRYCTENEIRRLVTVSNQGVQEADLWKN